MWSVIQFLNAKYVCPLEIQRQIVEVYGEGAVNEGNVRKCCCSKKAGLRCMMIEVGARTVEVENFQASSVQSQLFVSLSEEVIGWPELEK